jgi:peptidyl-prolyl cis-trans isomerase SurA
MTDLPTRCRALALALLFSGTMACAVAQGRSPAALNGDYIVAVINQELVTAVEVEQRLSRALADAARTGARLPPADELRRLALDSLIEERVIVTYARDSGVRVDDGELERVVQGVAAQNQLSPEQLRSRLRAEGIDYARFRANLRDQIMIERVREREVYQRIKVSDAEIDRYLEQRRAAAMADAQLNIAQILVTVADGADDATVAARRALALSALARVRGGEAFEAVALEVSEDPGKQRGGQIGLRPVSRLPDLFVEAVRSLKPGETAAEPVRSGAGFHVLKLVERRDGSSLQVTQTRARHILLRTSQQVSAEVAARRLAEFRRQIESGTKTFEDLARQHSEDGSAPAGGDLGWSSPGMMVPEFDQAMDALAIGGLSAPVVSRFGVHLIQVLERREVTPEPRQLREQARSALREQKFDDAYREWAADLRARAYVEMREPPL